jgi:flagellar biosynthesis/type III secretory pathway protein FliH
MEREREMMKTKESTERHVKGRKEGRKEGREEGRKEGRKNNSITEHVLGILHDVLLHELPVPVAEAVAGRWW